MKVSTNYEVFIRNNKDWKVSSEKRSDSCPFELQYRLYSTTSYGNCTNDEGSVKKNYVCN